jgi:hypothetical protein
MKADASRGGLTRTIADSRVKGGTDDGDVEELAGCSETLCVLQMCKRAYARVGPLSSPPRTVSHNAQGFCGCRRNGWSKPLKPTSMPHFRSSSSSSAAVHALSW